MKQTYKINPDLVAKLYKGGKITERTAKLHGYAEGGVVTPDTPPATPMADPLDNPALPQDWFSKLERGVATAAAPLIQPFTTGAGAEGRRQYREGIANRQLDVSPPQTPQFAAADTSIQPQLASMPTEGQVELETFEKPNPFAMPQRQIPQVGGMTADAAIRRAMQAGAEEGIRTASAIEGMQAVAKEAEDEEQQAIKDQQADLQTKQAEIENLLKEYKASSPDRAKTAEKVWSDMGTGQKVLAGIGMVFGAMAPDGINRAVQMMTKAIDQDLETQFKRQEQLGKLVGERRSLMGDIQKLYGDQRQARLAVRKLGLDQLQLEIEKYATKTKNQTAIANLAVARDQIANERLKTESEMLKAAGQNKDLFVPGLGYALTKEDASELKKMSTDLKSAKSGIDSLLKLDRTILPFTKDAAIANQLKTALKGNLRTFIVGPGTVSETDQKILDEAISDPTAFFQVNAKTRLRELNKALESKFRASAEARGMVAPAVETVQRAR